MTTIRINPALEQQLKHSVNTRAALKDAAEVVASHAKEIAKQEFYDTGAYHDSIEADAGETGAGEVGRVIARDYKAGWAELGFTDESGTHHQGHAILRRAANAAGLKTHR